MALPTQELEAMDSGIESRKPHQGAFALNLLYTQDRWELRKGFGQVTQYTTDLSKQPLASVSDTWGLQTHLGSTVINTSFGHQQIVSVFENLAYDARTAIQSSFIRCISVIIYDVTTNTRHEEVLFRATGESAIVQDIKVGQENLNWRPLASWHGHKETAGSQSGRDYRAWRNYSDENWWFQEFRGMVLFGAPKIGNFVYVPSILPKVRKPVQLDTILPHDAKMEHYSESALVSAVTVGQGPFGSEFPYIRGDDFPPASDATVMGNHVVYVSGRTVYITDPGFPGNIVASNTFEVPCETPLTAVAHQLGALWLFSEHETWRYQPSSGYVKSLGRLEKVSEHVGCASSALCTEMSNKVYWVDGSGIHTGEGLTVTTLTSKVEPLFRSSLLNPMTNYYADSGYTSMATDQPACQWSFSSKRASLTFSQRYRAIFLSMPEQNAVLVGGDGRWSMWSTESQVYQDGGADAVGVTRNITSPWILADGDDLFMVGGPDEEVFTDTNATPN